MASDQVLTPLTAIITQFHLDAAGHVRERPAIDVTSAGTAASTLPCAGCVQSKLHYDVDVPHDGPVARADL